MLVVGLVADDAAILTCIPWLHLIAPGVVTEIPAVMGVTLCLHVVSPGQKLGRMALKL